MSTDLHFTAFRYVADELSDAERLAFEEQLAVDQAAREAVAEAVALCERLAAAGPVSPGRSLAVSVEQSRRRGGLAWRAAGLVAAMAACVAIVWWNAARQAIVPPGQPGIVAETHEADVLAVVWAEAGEESAAEADDDAVDAVEEEEAESAVLLAERETHVPDWLLTAVVDGEQSGVEVEEVQEN